MKMFAKKSKPLILVLPVTYRCNCRCLMCSIWKKQDEVKDIEFEFIEKIFFSPLLSDLEEIQITGGEPVLRKDLLQIIALILEKCRNLKIFSLASNGTLTEEIVTTVGAILDRAPMHVNFYLSLSLDGIGHTHDQIRGREGVFEGVVLTARRLKERFWRRPNFQMGFNSVLSSFNFGEAEKILDYCQKEGFSVGFTLANTVDAYIESTRCNTGFALSKEQVLYVKSFFSNLNKQWPSVYFQMMIEMLGGAKRRMSCYAKTRGMLIDVDGSVYPCGQSKDLKCGNIYENDISQIWHGTINRKLRSVFKRECEKCTTNCYPPRASVVSKILHKNILR